MWHARMLRDAGWPGERSISSHEQQAIRAWKDALSSLASLDLIQPSLDYRASLDWLRDITAHTLFQPEDEGAPIQVMGLFESSGLSFDHLWVMGLHEEALPQPARPHPFLPLGLQRAHKLPRSSAERELEVATMVMRRLEISAREIVWSYPRFEGDTPLAPSPLLKRASMWTPPIAENIRAAASLETFADPCAPPVLPESMQSGGTRLLLDMAACPFRAWAFRRAGARALEEPEPGIRQPEPRYGRTRRAQTDLAGTGFTRCAAEPERRRASGSGGAACRDGVAQDSRDRACARAEALGTAIDRVA